MSAYTRLVIGRPLRARRAVLAALVLAAAPAAATVVARMSLARVVDEAACIVHARVVEVRSGRDEAGLPATWVTLAVTETLKGPEASTLTVKQYGVTDALPDGTLARIPGLPRYTTGEEAVLFLRGESRRGFTSPVGLGQGVFRVRHRAGRARVASDLAAPGAPAADTDLGAFLDKVRRLARSPE